MYRELLQSGIQVKIIGDGVAAGSGSSAIELTCGELEALSHAASWVDVCKNVCS